MPLSKAGEKLLRKVKKHILEEPLRLRMSAYTLNENFDAYRIEEGHKEFYGLGTGWGEPATQKVPKCGTAGCIAGWCTLLGNKENKKYSESTSVIAMQLLGFDPHSYKDPVITHRLFYVPSWSKANREAFVWAKTQIQRAKLTAKEIDVFIKEQRKLNRRVNNDCNNS